MENLSDSRTLAGRLFTALLLAAASLALADVHYVDVNSTNATPPYTNWTTAATNIQDAVDAAVAGDEVVVTNGVYQSGTRDVYGMSNRVAVTKALLVRSVNGPAVTSIVGNAPSGPNALRCVYLTNAALLSGFTLTNGATQTSGDFVKNQAGGGVWCESQSAIVTNCLLTGNGGRVISIGSGGGAYSGTLINCGITNNRAIDGGGAALSTLNNCKLSGNRAGLQGGGAEGCTLNNCVLVGNSAHEGGGAAYCMLNNCTATGNSGSFGGGAPNCTLRNCILFNNTNQTTCEDCSFPGFPFTGENWKGDPLFLGPAAGNLHLQPNSPCINAGYNSYVTNATDLDGDPRVVGGTVDIGAYEFQSPISIISYAWLQHYGLPTDGSADFTDPDGDGVDNYHEWLAGTDPTNRFSSPAQLTIIPSGTNVVLTWPTNAAGFTLQSTTNSGSSAVWSTNSPAPLVIAGRNTVTNPITGPQQFYRLRH